MKKQLLTLLSVWSFSYSYAMQLPSVGSNPVEHLQMLQSKSDSKLISIYNRIIPLLTPSDINTLIHLLDNQYFPEHRNFSKHVLFIKYVIDIFSKHKPEYSDAALVSRFKKYLHLIADGRILRPEEQPLLTMIRKLDWLLKDIVLLPPDLRDLAVNCFTGLGAALTAVIRYVPELSQLAKKARREELSFYFQIQMCSQIAPFHKKLLLEPIMTLLDRYTHNHQDSQSLVESKAKTLAGVIDEFQKKANNRAIQYQWGMYGSDGYLSQIGTDVDGALAEVIDHLPVHSLKRLFFLFVNPYVHPRPVRYALLLNALVREDFQEGIFVGDEIAVLKDSLMKTISYYDTSKYHQEDVEAIKEFLKGFNAYFIKALKNKLEDKMSPEKKRLLLKAGEAMFAWLQSGQFEQPSPLQEKQESASSPSLKRRPSITNTLVAAGQDVLVADQPVVAHRDSVKAFLQKDMEVEIPGQEGAQSPKKRLRFADNLENVLTFKADVPVESILPESHKELIVVPQEKEATLEEYKEWMRDLTVRLQQTTEQKAALESQLQEEQKKHEEMVTSYEAQLEEIRLERDQYKAAIEARQKPIDYGSMPRFL